MKQGKLYIFTGPSGTGKGTMLSRVRAQDANIRLSVSATTRKPRTGETNGVQYWFMSHDEFTARIAQGDFLEHAQYVGNFYGTPQQPVNDLLAQGFDVVLEIEVQGAVQVAALRPDAVMVFVAPPSMEVLRERLIGRQTDADADILARLEVAKDEMTYQNQFAYIIVNDDLEEATADLAAIFRAERCRNTV